MYTTVANPVHVRIVKAPKRDDCDLDGYDVSKFEVGEIYDIASRLAELLILCGYAQPEMRAQDRA